MTHVADKSKIPEVLQSLPWKLIPLYSCDLYTEFIDDDVLLLAIVADWTTKTTYDIVGVTISLDDGRMRALENGNGDPIEFEITDCDWYVKL